MLATAVHRGNEIEFTLLPLSSANTCNANKEELWHKPFGHIGQTSFYDLVRYGNWNECESAIMLSDGMVPN